ncbi:MAG: hypothetical protein Q9217_000717 [Psora testacea]
MKLTLLNPTSIIFYSIILLAYATPKVNTETCLIPSTTETNLNNNVTKPILKRTLRIKPIPLARKITNSAFTELTTLAIAQADTYIRDHGRDAPADFNSWQVKCCGVSFLLNKDYQTTRTFSYGLLSDSAKLLKWQLPNYDLRESNLLIFDNVEGASEVLVARGFVGMIGETGGNLTGLEVDGKYGVVQGLHNVSPETTN